MKKQGWYNIYNDGEHSVITIITHWMTFYFDISLSRFDKVSLLSQAVNGISARRP